MHSALLTIQKNELTEQRLYEKILPLINNPANRRIIEQMIAQEKSHYAMWRDITKTEVSPSYAQLWFYYLITRLLGLSFGLKLMEKGEGLVIGLYHELKNEYPAALKIIQEEQQHEQQLLSLINTRLLSQVSSIILGLNDALIELTGALAGFTLALNNTRLIALVGLITGIAASLSMGVSSYLSAKEDGKNPLTAAISTGGAYAITVALLIFPYFVFANAFWALGATMVMAVLIILVFNFYTAVCKNLPFGKRFAEMAGLSLGIATINFAIGYLIKQYLLPGV